jgi:hypothetical protein
VPIVLVFLDHKLGLDGGDGDLSANQQLYPRHLVTWVKHFPFHYGLDVVQDVIANVVHEHSHQREGYNVLTILFHALVDRRFLV